MGNTLHAFRAIYVSGLPNPMTPSELTELCGEFGNVRQAWVAHDPETGAQWSFGHVEFDGPETAIRAARKLHGMRFRGGVLAAHPVDDDAMETPTVTSHSTNAN